MAKMERFEKVITTLFGILFFFTPLIFWPFTSEVFEFNKLIAVYSITLLIVSTWITRMIYEKKIIFRRTILDIPLLVFIGSQILSTVFSVDPHTSLFGYYSRFNGGLLSIFSYSLLFWAFVSNVNFEKAKKLIFIFLGSALIVSSIGILEHFGVNPTCMPVQVYKITTDQEFKTKFTSLNGIQKLQFVTTTNCWVQDVKYRVFSTLGQPNWLAIFLAALIPFTWALGFKNKRGSKDFLLLSLTSAIFFAVLLFTKSRSGLLGFIAADIIFWGYMFFKKKNEATKPFLIQNAIILILVVVIGTQFGPSITEFLSKAKSQPQIVESGPVLEIGGTESGTIRKIVWKGAIELWKRYPIFGSGVETFAYTYYLVRPIEHNLVSEWDFVYNKAHNEYLNYAANTGTVGLISYLFFIGSIIYMLVKSQEDENFLLKIAILSGFVSILVSNFFGFSVVITQLQLFLFPAIAISLRNKKINEKGQKYSINSSQKFLVGIVIVLLVSTLVLIARYWRADTLYAKGKEYNRIGNPVKAQSYLKKASDISKNEALYHLDLATSYTDIAVELSQTDQKEQAEQFITLAIDEAEKALNLSPANVNIKRTVFTMYIKFSVIDQKYLINAAQTLQEALIQAPTSAKFLYNLGLIYARVGENELAISTIEKTIELKPNYKEARLAYALLLMDKNEKVRA
ncbi:MAG: O-antigen ligase family protein, partial [Microgenomates group bacterium]